MNRRRSPRRVTTSRVAIASEVVEEPLPSRWVLYPNHYGAFLAFADNPMGPFSLCECSKAAIENAIRFSRQQHESNIDPLRRAPLSNHYFPEAISERSAQELADPFTWLRFEPRLCHRCNLATPSLRYCHEMYGGQFVQRFGWYVNQTFFRVGVRPLSLEPLQNVCPAELSQKIEAWREVEVQHQAEHARLIALVEGPPRSDTSADERTYWHNVKHGEEKAYVALRRRAGQLKQAVINEIESITRKDFGFRAVGDGWISESMLFNIVKRLLPHDEIIRHHRPDWLQGLELDIFIPARNLGVEYQGQQHFRAVPAWGGEAALHHLQRRDVVKATICHQRGIALVAVDYTEPLTEEHVQGRLRSSGRFAQV